MKAAVDCGSADCVNCEELRMRIPKSFEVGGRRWCAWYISPNYSAIAMITKTGCFRCLSLYIEGSSGCRSAAGVRGGIGRRQGTTTGTVHSGQWPVNTVLNTHRQQTAGRRPTSDLRSHLTSELLGAKCQMAFEMRYTYTSSWQLAVGVWRSRARDRPLAYGVELLRLSGGLGCFSGCF
jgi:hypothetical protein